MTKENYKISKIQIGFYYLLMFLILIWFLIIQFTGINNHNAKIQSSNITYRGTFIWIHSDGSKEQIAVPGHYNVPAKETMVITTTLPENYTQSSLAIRSSLQDIRFYIDGVLRAEYSTKDHRLTGKNSASCYVFCPTSAADAGKELRIELTTNTSNYSGVVNEIYSGDKSDIWEYIFESYGLETIIAFFILFAGIITILFSIALGIVYDRKFDIKYNPKKEVLVTVGGSEAIDLMVRTLINPGDEVLIPEPCFVCYRPCTVMAGGVPVPIETKEEDNFRLLPEQLKEKITDKTKLLILPYPNNPTGGIMSKEDLEAIAEVLRGTNIMVLSDEIYAELRYDGEKHIPFSNFEGMKERTVVVSGFSKTFAMTGWRLGYALGPERIIKLMTKIHQYGIMSAPTTAQFAAIEALKSCDDDVAEMRREYNYRRRYIVDGFRAMGLSCFEPLGAFYVFPCIKSTGMTSEEFCQNLLMEEKVAVVPGNAFGESGEGFIRCSYAYSIENIQEALKRIEKFVKRHSK